MSDEAKWHWAEGMKYAGELLKSLLIINGAAAISMLTFIGNTKILNGPLIFGMVSFGIGVVGAVIAMLCAYLTQLHYGNAEVGTKDPAAWQAGGRLHYATYGAGLVSLVLFAAGICLVGWGGFLVLDTAPNT